MEPQQTLYTAKKNCTLAFFFMCFSRGCTAWGPGWDRAPKEYFFRGGRWNCRSFIGPIWVGKNGWRSSTAGIECWHRNKVDIKKEWYTASSSADPYIREPSNNFRSAGSNTSAFKLTYRRTCYSLTKSASQSYFQLVGSWRQSMSHSICSAAVTTWMMLPPKVPRSPCCLG